MTLPTVLAAIPKSSSPKIINADITDLLAFIGFMAIILIVIGAYLWTIRDTVRDSSRTYKVVE